MRIEHIGINVGDAKAVAKWYEEHLGFTTVRTAGPPTDMTFIADESGKVMIELYNNEKAAVPNYAEQDPLTLHVAFVSDDVATDRERLISAGATAVGEISHTPAGDNLAMLRDPWGLAIQLCQRAEPMI